MGLKTLTVQCIHQKKVYDQVREGNRSREFFNKYSLLLVDNLIVLIYLQYFRSTQLSPFMSIGECNSEPLTFGVNSINHTEGGWPKVLLLL